MWVTLFFHTSAESHKALFVLFTPQYKCFHRYFSVVNTTSVIQHRSLINVDPYFAIAIPPRSQKSYPTLSDAPVAFCKPCHCYPSSFPEVLPDTVRCSCGVLKTRPGLTKHLLSSWPSGPIGPPPVRPQPASPFQRCACREGGTASWDDVSYVFMWF